MGTLRDAKNYGGVGAILLIVIVDIFLIFVAQILMIVAFSSIQEQPPAPRLPLEIPPTSRPSTHTIHTPKPVI